LSAVSLLITLSRHKFLRGHGHFVATILVRDTWSRSLCHGTTLSHATLSQRAKNEYKTNCECRD